MAYAALVSFARLLEQIKHHPRFFYAPLTDDEQLLGSLHKKISFLQGFLDKYSHHGGDTVRSLEAQIMDAVYRAQDIIEYSISDCAQSHYDSCGVTWYFKEFVYATRTVEWQRVRNRYGKDLVKAIEHIDSIVEDVMSNKITESSPATSHDSAPASSSSTLNGRNKIVGLDEDVLGIKERLCGESSKLEIISIVGMGGLGKTTLARILFNDSLVLYHFHARAWITISQKYHLRGILLALLKSLVVATEDSSKMTDEKLMEGVYKSLKGRSYLIIMDDMWGLEAWDDLRRIFPNDNNGSRILITTRLTYVAEYSSGFIHQMHFLNDDQSWNLLRETVFREQSCPKELEETGKIIAENCGGLPLAVAVVSGILTKVKRTLYHWKNIEKNIRSTLPTSEHLSKILSLSYDHLPNHLKACFLYMGGFPEDHEIPISKLIMLWVAEGFLIPAGSKSLEQVAKEYLEDLIKRNLVLIISKKRSEGFFISCGMHDLLRELCIRKAQEEKFLHVYAFDIDLADQYRLTIQSHIQSNHLVKNTFPLHIRSVLLFCNDQRTLSFVLRLQLLRVLDMPKTILDSFRVVITRLLHLRYLAFAYQKSFSLPPAISKLHNLQTIIVHVLSFVTSTRSFKIWKTPQLRHLIFKGKSFRIPSPPRFVGQFPVLENLQTLSGVKNFKFTRKAIGMFPNLKELMAYCTYTNCAKRGLNNLVLLDHLETLNLHFLKEAFRGRKRRLLIFLANCYALPVSLKELTLTGARPPSDNMAIIGSLPNLEVLRLKHFTFVERYWESNEGEFPRLNFLHIEYANLACWRAESAHFPCLEHLIIKSCGVLKEIPDAIGDIATLVLIEVGPHSKSAANSAVLILEEQRRLGNDTLQVWFH